MPTTHPAFQNRPLLTGTIALALFLVQSTASFGAEGYWSERAPMPTARWAHEAEVIDGKIYAIGGVLANRTETGVNELYDPATDTWTSKAPMPTARGSAMSAVVNGKIYMIAGAVGFQGSNWINDIRPMTTVEAYDPVTDTWTSKAPIPTQRTSGGAFVVDNKIHVFSGWRGPGNEDFANNIEVYDPETDTWEDLGAVPINARSSFAVSAANGKMYQCGGTRHPNADGGRETTEIDPGANIWTPKAFMPAQRHMHSASALHGKIYAMGGSAVNGPALAAVQVYDPQTNMWKYGLAMPRARGAFETVELDGKIYAFGGLTGIAWGSRGTIYASMDVYTPGSPTLKSITHTASGTTIITLPLGETFDIEYSPSLEPNSWIVIQRGISGSYEDTDPARTGSGRGFYRGVIP